jgi:flagellar biosynthesis protein FliR
MSVFELFLVGRFLTFVLVLTRISGVIATAPLFSAEGIPVRARALLAVMLALLVTPLQDDTVTTAAVGNVVELARLMTLEALIGLLLGLGMNILFTGIQVSGQIVSQMSGMSLADVFNPGFDTNVSVFSQLFYFLTLAVFVAIGGHRMMIQAVLETFEWAPPGYAMLGDTYVQTLVNILSHSFALGIRAAAPALAALLLSTIVLGLISRTLPQLNIIMVGFNLNAMLTLGALMLSLGAIAWTFQEQTVDMLRQLQETVTSG